MFTHSMVLAIFLFGAHLDNFFLLLFNVLFSSFFVWLVNFFSLFFVIFLEGVGGVRSFFVLLLLLLQNLSFSGTESKVLNNSDKICAFPIGVGRLFKCRCIGFMEYNFLLWPVSCLVICPTIQKILFSSFPGNETSDEKDFIIEHSSSSNFLFVIGFVVSSSLRESNEKDKSTFLFSLRLWFIVRLLMMVSLCSFVFSPSGFGNTSDQLTVPSGSTRRFFKKRSDFGEKRSRLRRRRSWSLFFP